MSRPPSNGEFQTVVEAAAQLVPGGLVLQRSRILGPVGYAVICFDADTHAVRAANTEVPLVRFSEVAARLETAPSLLPPSAVSLLAFISMERPTSAVSQLARVRALCRTILLVPEDHDLGEPMLSEFDCLGITVAGAQAGGEVELQVLGDPGRRPGSELAPAWARVCEEQLYAAALAG
ncbi:MAG: hypothetical protein JWM84_1327 [Nocardioides sp.]|nr:hypothetical protein [Nocardioides sp.]